MRISFVVAMALLGGCSSTPVEENASNEYIVDFKDDVSAADIKTLEEKTGLEFHANSLLFSKTKIVSTYVDPSNRSKIDLILDSGDVEGVEPVQYYSVIDGLPTADQSNSEEIAPQGCSEGDEDDASRPPNDPLYREGKQWNMTMIGVEEAWKVTRGAHAVIAVLDTGISTGDGQYPRVPDLRQTCMKEGYNFVDDDKDPYDWDGHGTHVGGTIAQSTNNGIGVVGIANKACLLPVKVLGDDGSGRTDDIAEAIIWATDNGAQVINMSLGGGGYSQVMANALKYAVDHNVFVACAAGNAGRSTIEYPAAMPGCHAVSAVGKSGKLAYYSSYGTNGGGVFIAGPGGDQKADGQEGGVWQNTILDGQPTKHGYFPFQGTSMATPHVAGVAGLVVSTLGKDYKLAQVEKILKDSATPAGEKAKYGSGLLSASKAVNLAGDAGSSSGEKLAIKFVEFFLGLYSVITLIGWLRRK